jgi:hypothetical protein
MSLTGVGYAEHSKDYHDLTVMLRIEFFIRYRIAEYLLAKFLCVYLLSSNMSRGSQAVVDWESQTVVDEDDLASYVFEFDSSGDINLDIRNYEIEIDPHGVRKRSDFLNFLKNQMPNFIFSESKQKEIDKRGWTYDKARRKIGDISNKSDGFYSELLLYLIMEGFFGFPLVSHKMAVKEDYNTQVKGTDGLYVGTFEDDEVVGYGEAKFYQNKSSALDDAIEGVSEYHGVDGINEREAEIDVARENISGDLSKEEVERLLDDMEERNVPITHPILIAYEKSNYDKIEGKCESRDDAVEMIKEFHERENFIDPTKRRVTDAGNGLQDIQLLVFFLRVKNTQKFKDDLEGLI